MSLQPTSISPVPEETARVARAAFPKGNRYLEMGDVLGTIYTDELFADLYPQRGQPAGGGALALGTGDSVSVSGRTQRPASCRGGARAH